MSDAINGHAKYPRPTRFAEIDKEIVMEAIETLSRPIVTMTNNFKAGQVQAKNKAATFEALDKSVELLRVAYFNVKHS